MVRIQWFTVMATALVGCDAVLGLNASTLELRGGIDASTGDASTADSSSGVNSTAAESGPEGCSASCGSGSVQCVAGSLQTCELQAGCYQWAATTPCPSTANGSATCDGSSCALTCNAGYFLCNETCTNEQTDSDNCGACGHGCQGGACASGACEPITLASGQDAPGYIAVDGTSVYWGSATGVYKVAIGGGPVFTLATAAVELLYGGSGAIAIDDTNVYWEGGNQIARVPINGGNVTAIFVENQGSPFELFPGLAVSNTLVYFTEEDTTVQGGPANPGLLTVPLTSINANDATDPSSVGISPVDFVADSNNLYVTSDVETTTGSVVALYEVSLTGGATATLASDGAGAVAVDSSNVYWFNTTSLLSVPIAGGSPTVLASGQNPASVHRAIAADGTNVYWLNAGVVGEDGGLELNGAVLKVSVDGGTPAVIAMAQTPQSIVADATSVYWTDAFAGSVMKLAK